MGVEARGGATLEHRLSTAGAPGLVDFGLRILGNRRGAEGAEEELGLFGRN